MVNRGEPETNGFVDERLFAEKWLDTHRNANLQRTEDSVRYTPIHITLAAAGLLVILIVPDAQ
jgi:hypothetical protein